MAFPWASVTCPEMVPLVVVWAKAADGSAQDIPRMATRAIRRVPTRLYCKQRGIPYPPEKHGPCPVAHSPRSHPGPAQNASPSGAFVKSVGQPPSSGACPVSEPKTRGPRLPPRPSWLKVRTDYQRTSSPTSTARAPRRLPLMTPQLLGSLMFSPVSEAE